MSMKAKVMQLQQERAEKERQLKQFQKESAERERLLKESEQLEKGRTERQHEKSVCITMYLITSIGYKMGASCLSGEVTGSVHGREQNKKMQTQSTCRVLFTSEYFQGGLAHNVVCHFQVLSREVEYLQGNTEGTTNS